MIVEDEVIGGEKADQDEMIVGEKIVILGIRVKSDRKEKIIGGKNDHHGRWKFPFKPDVDG